jgi:hypothetical protein
MIILIFFFCVLPNLEFSLKNVIHFPLNIYNTSPFVLPKLLQVSEEVQGDISSSVFHWHLGLRADTMRWYLVPIRMRRRIVSDKNCFPCHVSFFI